MFFRPQDSGADRPSSIDVRVASLFFSVVGDDMLFFYSNQNIRAYIAGDDDFRREIYGLVTLFPLASVFVFSPF